MPVIKSVKLNTRVISRSGGQTINNDNTLQDDDTLKIPVNANQNLTFFMFLKCDGNGTADLKYAFTIPAGGAIQCLTNYPYDSGTSYFDGTTARPTVFGAGVNIVGCIGMYQGGAAGGYIQLQWAQNTKNLSDLTVMEGSCLVAFI